jgi:hypothetical protein
MLVLVLNLWTDQDMDKLLTQSDACIQDKSDGDMSRGRMSFVRNHKLTMLWKTAIWLHCIRAHTQLANLYSALRSATT